jgi:hypothetical protein
MSGRARVRRLAVRMSSRDLAILATLREFRLMTGAQLRRLHFASGQLMTQARKARAALKRLTDLHVIVRLDRRVGGIHAGSGGYVYGISGWGHAVLDLGQEATRQHRRVVDTKPAFQAHVLAVSELAVELHEHERAGLCVIDELRAEPGAWRWFSGIGGGRRVLKPDAFVRLTIGEFELSNFIEQDMATESPATITRKLGVYHDYFRAGQEQQARGVFPLVWWLVPDTKRLQKIAQAIGRMPDETRALFTVALIGEAVSRLVHHSAEGGAL